MTDVSRVPSALRALKGWLLWRVEKGLEGKPRKVPCYLSGARRHGVQGSDADRRRLATFEDACAVYLSQPGWAGLGLAMLPDWGLVGLDFDACVTDGAVVPEVLQAVSGTYAEFSPSGTGVRAFVRGSVADRKSPKDPARGVWGFETFHAKGFLTITGNVLDYCELAGLDDTVAHLNGAIPQLFEARFGGPGSIVVREPLALGEVRGPKPEGLGADALRSLLRWVDNGRGYDRWTRVGMALHHESRGEPWGLALWDEWSSGGHEYPGEGALAAKWQSFGRQSGSPTTVGWLRGEAERQSGGAALDDSAFEALPVVPWRGGPAGDGGEGAGEVGDELPAFDREKTGAIKPTVTNTVMALRRADLCGQRVAYDEFRDEIAVSRPGAEEWVALTDADVVRMRMRLEAVGFKGVPKELARDGLVLVAAENHMDSAQLWLQGVEAQWDGRPRVERFLIDYMGCADGEYVRAVARYMWTAMAGRVIEPGVKADMVPIYAGAQGIVKSSSIEALVPDPQFFVEVDLDEDESDTVRKLRGALVGEIAELSGLHTRALEAIKKFVVRKVEKWVPKYKEFPSTFARRLVFIGTTNRTDILADETGNRRWLPVTVGRADLDAIVRDREQLWAEAAAMFRTGGVAWQDAERLAGGEHDAFLVEDPWAGPVSAWLVESDGFGSHLGPRGGHPFTSHELLSGALNIATRDMDRAAQRRITAILKRSGYEPKTVRRDGVPEWCWVRAL